MKKETKIPVILRQHRKMAGLTCEQVVDKLKSRGIVISPKTLSGYENGVSTPNVNTFLCLCEIYGISDIMGAFGYNLPLATGDNEWSLDLYNDFFNASLLEYIYILLSHGVPSFEGYQDKLSEKFPHDAASANMNRLWSEFSSLNESQQGTVFFYIHELKAGVIPHIPNNLSGDELTFISDFRRLNSLGQDEALHFVQHLSETDSFKKSTGSGYLPAAE